LGPEFVWVLYFTNARWFCCSLSWRLLLVN
jgi:hypothetical protein